MRKLVVALSVSAMLLASSPALGLPMPGPKTYGANQHPRTLKATRTVQQHVKTMNAPSYLDRRK